LLVVFPVGFDEKFIVRALMRRREDVDGLIRGDKLIAVLPEGYRDEQRALNALNAIESIVGPIVGEENIVHLEVPSTGDEMVATIKRSIEDNLTRDRVVLAVLSGGMRPLVVGTLLALMSLKSARFIFGPIQQEMGENFVWLGEREERQNNSGGAWCFSRNDKQRVEEDGELLPNKERTSRWASSALSNHTGW